MAYKTGGPSPEAAGGKRKAMEAVSRIYTAGVLAGMKSWIDGSQMIADSAWAYYREFNSMMDSAEGRSTANDPGKMKERIKENVRGYLRNLENLSIQYQADFESRVFSIIEDVFGPDATKTPAAPAGSAPTAR